MSNKKRLGLTTLVALVIGNTLGAGVFTTSGFALDDLGSPTYVLLAWLVGGLLALCGAISYGSLSRLMPVSGGEYYFLSRGVHPLVGFIAGWISLWAGFTGAIALSAITFEAYLLPASGRDLLPGNLVATLAILLAALAHGLRIRSGVVLQNLAVAMKLLFLAGFMVFVLLSGEVSNWDGVQAWRANPVPEFSMTAFAITLMWVSFSYSGFYASIYVASEVRNPLSTVPRSMILATLLISALYLLLNAIFVLAPAPDMIAGQKDIAAIAAAVLAGDSLATAMRAIIAIALFTSISAMIMVGPRVYAQMAEDGLMPRILRFKEEAPGGAVALQAVLAITLVWLTGLRELLSYLGFTLGLSSAVTVASLFVVVRRRKIDTRQLPGYPWVPAIFVSMTLLFAGLAAVRNPWEMLAAVLTIASAIVVYLSFGQKHHRLLRRP